MDSHIEKTEYVNDLVDFEQFRFNFFTNNDLLKK